MLLNVNHRLDGLSCAITDRIPLSSCRERPSTLTRMPIAVFHERRILLNLTLIQPLQRHQQTLQSELSGVGMAYTPRSVPDTFWCLAIVEELDSSVGYISVRRQERKGNSNNEYIVK